MGRFELRELSGYSKSLPQDLPSCMDAVGAHRGCRESKSEPELILKFRRSARFGEVSDFTFLARRKRRTITPFYEAYVPNLLDFTKSAISH